MIDVSWLALRSEQAYLTYGRQGPPPQRRLFAPVFHLARVDSGKSMSDCCSSFFLLQRDRHMAHSPRRMSLTTLRRPCSMTSRATIKSSACRPCTLAHPSSTRQRNSSMSSSSYSLPALTPFRRFTGIEFALAHALPPSLFIIHKRERLSPDQGPSHPVFSSSSASPPQSGLLPHTLSSTTVFINHPMSTPCSQTDWYLSPSLHACHSPAYLAYFLERPPVLPRPPSQTSPRLHPTLRFRLARDRLIAA